MFDYDQGRGVFIAKKACIRIVKVLKPNFAERSGGRRCSNRRRSTELSASPQPRTAKTPGVRRLCKSHSQTPRSQLPVGMRFPFGENRTQIKAALCPGKPGSGAPEIERIPKPQFVIVASCRHHGAVRREARRVYTLPSRSKRSNSCPDAAHQPHPVLSLAAVTRRLLVRIQPTASSLDVRPEPIHAHLCPCATAELFCLRSLLPSGSHREKSKLELLVPCARHRANIGTSERVQKTSTVFVLRPVGVATSAQSGESQRGHR